MTNLDPCLHGCDAALAEAELLIAMLTDRVQSLDPELSAVQSRIASLRHEVERLRGMPAVPIRKPIHPDWIDLAANGSPWSRRVGDQPGGGKVGGA